MKTGRIWFLIWPVVLSLTTCSPDYTPKPRGFFRISLPDKAYRSLEGEYPYSFDYPTYAIIVPYKGVWSRQDTSAYWINLEIPVFRCKLHLTYKTVKQNLAQLIDDAHNYAYKHTVKADAIIQSEYLDSVAKVYGVLYDIKGNTASSLQFFMTDSTSNFLRGALYFDCEPNKDSLEPVREFLRKDVVRLVETLKWKGLNK